VTYPVVLEAGGEGYVATLALWPHVRVTAPTREAALARARDALAEQLRSAEVVMVDVEEDPWQEIAGKYADDERLREICDEAYAARDAERVP